MVECTKNECQSSSTWFYGDVYSSCEKHKAELQKMLEGTHLHMKCDKCFRVFHTTKVCAEEGEHEFLCMLHPETIAKLKDLMNKPKLIKKLKDRLN